MKIVQNLWQVVGGAFTAAEDAAIYLIRFEQQAALIGAGLRPIRQIHAGGYQ